MQMRAIHKKRKHGGGSGSSPGPADTAAARPAPAPLPARPPRLCGAPRARAARLRAGQRCGAAPALSCPGGSGTPQLPSDPQRPATRGVSGAHTAHRGVAAPGRGAVNPKLRGHPNFLAIKEVSERPTFAFQSPEGLSRSLPNAHLLFLPQRFIFLFLLVVFLRRYGELQPLILLQVSFNPGTLKTLRSLSCPFLS